MRALAGDAKLLPQAYFLSRLILRENIVIVMDCEDFTPALKLFRICRQWNGSMAYAKQVPASACGGDPNVLVYVAIYVCPMGWPGAVHLIQKSDPQFCCSRMWNR